MKLARTIKRVSGVDTHILATLVMRLWTVIAGAAMVIGIPYWFSGAEQGYYFTFYSLIGLQVFFELGLNYVVVQFVGHEAAHLGADESGRLSGDSRCLDRLASLARLLHRWYGVVAIVFFVVVSLSGIAFFRKAAGDDVHGWLFGWSTLALFSAANLYLSPFLAFAEGLGRVAQVARLRLWQSIGGYTLLWVLLATGAGLWAVPVVAMVASIVSAYWLFRGNGNVIVDLRRRKIGDQARRVSWREEIFPFQWRIALSWVSGYFIFQLFNPMIFSHQGAVAAGRVGLALQIFSTILTVSMSWVNAKIPELAGHIARGELMESRMKFVHLFVRSGICNLLGCALFLIAVLAMKGLGIALAHRVADLSVLACIAIVTVTNHFIFSGAAFMRAHKQEPLMVSSIVVGVLSLAAVYVGVQYSVLLTMALYAAVTVFVGLPWCVAIFRRYWKPTFPSDSGACMTTGSV